MCARSILTFSCRATIRTERALHPWCFLFFFSYPRLFFATAGRERASTACVGCSVCASFHCSFNAGEPYTFVIYEAFDDDGAALDAHRQTEHYKAMSEFKKREFFGALGDARMRKEHYKAMNAFKTRESCVFFGALGARILEA